MKKGIMYVGMDVHQKSIDITTAVYGHDGKVVHFGCIDGGLKALDKAVDKLLESGAELRIVYEAGAVRLRDLPPSPATRCALHGGVAGQCAEESVGSGEDGSARLAHTGGAAPRRSAAGDLRAGGGG